MSFLFCILLFRHSPGFGQNSLPYKNPALPVEERVRDLLSRMTIGEKFWQLYMIPGSVKKGEEDKYKNGIFGFQPGVLDGDPDAREQLLRTTASGDAMTLASKINEQQRFFVEKTRLGIPVIFFEEGLHGLVREGATSFPQSIALAATFDTLLMRQVAGAIGKETKIRGIRQILSPVLNIASDVRWGRTEETYGEDPLLCTAMAVAYIKTIEDLNIIATPKHFIANVGDGGRDSYPVHLTERLLDEIYFPPFRAAVEKAGARSLMTAYNSLDGTPCSANAWLLTKKLKTEWKFGGFVISDAGAVGGANVLHNTSADYPGSGEQAISAGLDVIFQTAYSHYQLFIPPFLDGRLDLKRIDDAVSRVLRAKFQLGLFENPYVSEKDNEMASRTADHKAIARKAAEESIVLLKNDHETLPISPKIRSIALIGTDAIEARLGGYSGPGNGKSTIKDAIEQRLKPGRIVIYAAGCGRTSEEWVPVKSSYLTTVLEGDTRQGLSGEYFNNLNCSGAPALKRLDPEVDFQWTLSSPAPVIGHDFYSVRWTGKIHAPESGRYRIGLDGNDGYRLFIGDSLIVDRWSKQSYHSALADFVFEKDREYPIRIEFFEPIGNAHIRLIWNLGIDGDWNKRITEAVDASRQADMSVIVAGIEEGEFRDRAMLTLPGHQEELIRQVAQTGKPLVVLLVGGSAVCMNNWLDKTDAVAAVWYPGEEGGSAIAAFLFGDYNPAGRLPVSFPQSEAQLPLVYNHKPTGRGDDYNNLSGLPLFPFGFGLSYTHFDYSGLRILKNNISASDSTLALCTIRNTGTREGDEVVQLYIRDLIASVARPSLELKGFQRIHLLPGEAKEVAFLITPALLSMFNRQLESVVEPGDFSILIGASSRDIRLKEILTVAGR